MRISDLPQFEWLANRKDVKVVRHKDLNINLPQLYRQSKFEEYQNGQGRDVFARAKYLISFLAERDKYAKFVGVWEIQGMKYLKKKYIYQTEKISGFQEMEGRLIVYWGEGTRSWCQWLHRAGNKYINELLPPGFVKEFPGFYDFTLTYSELREIATNPDANRDWIRMLRAVAGVYAIQDQATEKIYIGSAYGINGLWGRWQAYATHAHGGNKELQELVEKVPNAPDHFLFSILRALEPNARKDEVIAHENLLKEKLGSRVHGLNSN